MKFQQKFFSVETTRLLQYELLRYLVLFGLVMYHVGYHWIDSYNEMIPFKIVSLWCYMPVAFFAFLSGFFLAKSSKIIATKSLFQYLVYGLINLMVVAILCSTTSFATSAGSVSSEWLKDTLIYGGRDWGFFRNMMIIYLFCPILNIGFRSVNKGGSLIFVVVLYILTCLYGQGYTPSFINGESILALVTFFLIGSGGSLYGIHLFGKKVTLIYSGILIGVMLIVQLLYAFLADNTDELFNIYNHFGFSFGWVIAFINIFSFIEFKGIKSQKVISIISLMANFIYLFEAVFEFIVCSYITCYIPINELKGIVSALLVMLFTSAFAAIGMFPTRYISNALSFYTNFVFTKLGNFLSRVGPS